MLHTLCSICKILIIIPKYEGSYKMHMICICKIHYYKRLKWSLMLQKEKRCIKSQGCKLLNKMKMCTFFLLCLNNIFFFHLVLPFRSYRRFPEDKISSINPDIQILALKASCFLLKHHWAFESSVIVANESLSCPQWEKMDLKII